MMETPISDLTKPQHLLSIVVPVFNREALLSETLDSLATQTARPLEIVLVDNGSTDGSGTLCDAFQLRMQLPDVRVHVLHVPQIGANRARNLGFDVSTGAYVWFFDSDDCLHPDSVARVVRALHASDEPDVLVCPYRIKHRNGSLLRRPHRFSADPAAHLIDPVVATHNVCIRRKLVETIGGWNPDLARWQDFEFGFRVLLAAETVAWMDGPPLYLVRDHADAISGPSYAEDLDKLESSLTAVRRCIDTLGDGTEKDRLLRALGFRWACLAGMVCREGKFGASTRLLQRATVGISNHRRAFVGGGMLSIDRFYRFCAWYVGKGGRGCWRLADVFL